MGRIEREIKKKVKNTKEEYNVWYNKHEEQIAQRLDESEVEIDLGNIKVKSRSKLYIFAGIAALFIVVILAIVLPLTFSTDDGLEFYEIGDLRIDNVEADEFYEVIEEAGLNIVDLSDYESASYAIYYSSDNTVKGGVVETFSENYFLTIRIYTADVSVDTIFDKGYEVYNGVIDINYHTEYVDDTYNTIGQANYLGMTYVIEYMSLYDDVTLLFDDIFV